MPSTKCEGLSYPTRFLKSRGIVIRNNILEYRTTQAALLRDEMIFMHCSQWFYLAIFKALYRSHSQSKNGLYFPNFMYFSTYFPNNYEIFSQMFRKRKLPKIPNKIIGSLQIKQKNILNRHFSCSCSDTIYSKNIKKNRKKSNFWKFIISLRVNIFRM